jgi:hypothetical protein
MLHTIIQSNLTIVLQLVDNPVNCLGKSTSHFKLNVKLNIILGGGIFVRTRRNTKYKNEDTVNATHNLKRGEVFIPCGYIGTIIFVYLLL